MITFKNLTMKNFMSVGNATQSVNLNDDEFTLILGENLDLGGNDSRNGVGKSTILNALSYALYGNAMTKIKKPNLINKTNGKNMLVSLDFAIDGVEYRIERGRKPEVLKFVIDGHPLKDPDSDEAQGENRFTQEEIERKIGFSENMFKNIVALTTNGQPFLSSPAAQQREVIENLLGITKMSEKAEKLRIEIKLTKDNIKREEFKISAVQEANKRIEQNIKSLSTKESAFENKKTKSISVLKKEIVTASQVDLEAEIAAHNTNKETQTFENSRNVLNKEITSLKREVKTYNKNLALLEEKVHTTSDNECPTCGSTMDDEVHRRVTDEYNQQIEEVQEKISSKSQEIEKLTEELGRIPEQEVLVTYYDDVEAAYEHKSKLEQLCNELERIENEVNPFTDEVENLRENGLQVIDYDPMNNLTSLKEHQEFLLKLLTNKDSFIRKKIINQNLAYLNNQLDAYLEKIGLPHKVEFQPDLSVDISEHGRDLDFDNLSRGEKTRLMLSLSWAFRDVYEQLNDGINLLFIDELMDNGLDTSGVESSVKVLKNMIRESNRNVLLISHRDELIGRIDDVLYVRKEGGFTSFYKDS